MNSHFPLALAALALAACGDTVDDTSDAGTPPRIVINEIVPANATGCADEAGEKDDWVELHNPGTAAVDLAGWSVSDDPDVPLKKQFAEGVKIAAGGYLVLWADDLPAQGPTHLPFKLKAAGEEFLLFDPKGAVADRHAWQTAVDDVALARLPNGSGAFAVCASPTCGASNGAACGK